MSSRKAVQVEKVSEYQGHTGSLFALAVDHVGNTAYTSGDDGVVAAWDLGSPDHDGSGILKVGAAVYALHYIEEWQWLVVGMSDGTVHVVDPGKKQIIHTLRKITEAVYGLHYEEERGYLWVLYGKGYLSVIRFPVFEETGFRRLAQDNLRDILFSPFDESILFASSDQRILQMDQQSGDIRHQWDAHDRAVFSLAMHPEGKYLLSGGMDAHLNVWDPVAPFQSRSRIPAHNFTVNAIAFSPTAPIFVTGSRDKSLKVWDAESLELLKVIDMFRNGGHKHSVNRLAFLADGTLLSAGDDRRLIRWRLQIGQAM